MARTAPSSLAPASLAEVPVPARPFALPLLALLAACPQPSDKEPEDTSGQETGIPTDDDRDDDGYDAVLDCDDDNPYVHPSAEEVCDGVDNDCDDLLDEGVSFTFYLDADQDGYGTAATTAEACEVPDGYATESTDCDDADPGVNPAADEACNAVDDDCDGEVDEDEAVDAVTVYLDADGDGFGRDDATYTGCAVPDGYADYGGDCDDEDARFHPGAEEADCEDPNDYNCDGSTGYADGDEDGFAACAECDDADATHFPGADEYCDGADDDCDGVIDEEDALDASTWYADEDADGYGEASATALACEQPDGYADNPDDCDDAVASTFPGADETCNETDDDCDGETDEEATDALAWYDDADGDGYGDPASETLACAAPEGAVADATDCDDAVASTFPGADETCNETDDDCDGETDEDEAIDAGSWYPDEDGDGYGWDTEEPVVSCAAPEGWVASFTDCDDEDATVNPGADEVCDEVDDDCDGQTDEDEALDASTWYADADADGYGDPASAARACEAPEGHVENAEDCDDASDARWPGAEEVCDGADDDCDGETDEDEAVDASTWYADADVDGFGDASSSRAACAAPEGWVADDTDCDDADASAFPGADEVCDEVDDDCDGEVDEDATDASRYYRDVDNDRYGDSAEQVRACSRPSGYRARGGDCDDDDAGVYPGASELCDGVDQDCDGETDEGATDAATWYADADEDGYGDALYSELACEAPAGWLADASDCDGADAGVHPGAEETCDGADQDCDGRVDEEATDAGTWYADVDGDGYGDAASSSEGCEAPAGHVADDEDCDDGDGEIHPGADERCDDVDQDCDGRVDEDAVDLGAWYQDDDGDGYGDDDTLVERCEAPADYVAEGGDCDDGASAVNPGADEVCQNAVDDDCDGSSDPCALSGDASASDADVVLLGEDSGDRAAYALAGAGDVDGDGLMDLLIGAPGNDRRSSSAGASYLVLGAPTGTLSLTDADAILVGEAASDASGEAVAGAGDVDGDGYDDVLVGGKGHDGGGSSAGAAWLLAGPVSGTLSLSSADTTLLGEDASDYAGAALDGAGDLDGSGHAWVAVGARNHVYGGVKGGAVYLLHSPASGDVELSTADAMVVGTTAYDYAGTPAGAGDLDGDGVADLLVGAEGVDVEGSGCGGAYLFLGPLSGVASIEDADGARYGVEYGDAAGAALDGVGDTDGDGYNDTLIGAYKADYSAIRDAGGAYLYSGDWSGAGTLADAAAVRYGEARGDYAAISVAGAGDTDGDGLGDLLVGAWYNDDGGTDAGGAWLVLGPVSGAASLSSAEASWAGAAATDYAGYAVAGPGDVDADGKADLLFGAYYNDSAASNAGAAYLVFGTGL